MRIGLMADIPDKPVARRVEHPMQRDSELHHTQAGSEVAAGYGDSVDRFLAQFGRQLRQVGCGKLAQILWGLHEIEKGRL